ncbi:MAG TPA: hypothetical protein VHX42_04875, partial [Candidatus Babeliales bacterium]|nr:hypothetical protein [Candidatus Babeliales bacterium]
KKSMQQLAKNGDDEAQIKLTNHLLGGCFPSLDCLKANKAETNITLDLLAFLHPLAQEKKIIELEDIKHTIDNLKCNDENRIPQPISPAVAYILYTCNYLQSIENRDKNYNLFLLNQRNCFQTPEIETICQFLINYGDSKLSAEDAAKKFTHTIIELTKSQHDLLSEIARMPICSQVITQLNKVHFPENDVSFIDIHYVLAELYYNKKDYKNADKHYDQLYTQCSLSTKNNFTQLKSHAFIAYVITTENFDIKKDTEKINFFANVTFMEYFLRQKKINPQLSYKIGLFTQEAFKIYPYIKKDRLLRDVLGHLTYAQSYESWNQKELIILTNMQTSLHISLSDNQTYKQNYDLALNHLQQGLTHHAAYSNNPQDSEILKLLEHTAQKNPKFYTQYAQWITTILHLIYYPDKQKNPLFQTYPPSGFISSDFCLQLLPYLECAYKKTKPINMKLVT